MAFRSGGCLSVGVPCLLTGSPSQRSQGGRAADAKIQASFKASDRAYGARRGWGDMLAEASPADRAQDRASDALTGPSASPMRRGLPKEEGVQPEAVTAPNLLDRQCTASRPTSSGKPMRDCITCYSIQHFQEFPAEKASPGLWANPATSGTIRPLRACSPP